MLLFLIFLLCKEASRSIQPRYIFKIAIKLSLLIVIRLLAISRIFVSWLLSRSFGGMIHYLQKLSSYSLKHVKLIGVPVKSSPVFTVTRSFLFSDMLELTNHFWVAEAPYEQSMKYCILKYPFRSCQWRHQCWSIDYLYSIFLEDTNCIWLVV